jgi:tRNA U34 5-carboxymethylaminomethyl modifying GTPase MnmE/TrmE
VLINLTNSFLINFKPLGAVASSAPVKAQLDFPEYLEVVTASLDTTGPECNKNIANATQQVDRLLQTAEGVKKLTQTFRLMKVPVHYRADFV